MKRSILSKIVAYLVLLIMTIFVCLPFLWTFITSIKTEVQMFSIPPVWIPHPITWGNYKQVFQEGTFQSNMFNSLVASGVSTIISLAIGAPAAYGFAKYRYKLSGTFFASIVAVRMFPPIILGIPFFLMMKDLGLINNIFALIITYIPLELTLVIWILEGFFRELPREIEEAAEIDGLGALGTFLRIAIPLSLPSIVVAAILSFLAGWNEFMFALTLTRSAESQTMPVGIAGYVTSFQTFWGKMSATGMLYVIPVILFTIFAQKGLVKGLTSGSSK